MSDRMRRWLTAVAAMLFGMGWIGVAAGQGYPNRPMTMIVPFPAGGATDTVVQVLADPSAQRRFEELGIQISAPDQQSPEALRAFQKAEAERWWPIITASNLKAE